MFIWSGLWVGVASGAPVLGHQPYAVVMCRYAGDPAEPASFAEIEDVLGVAAGPGTAGTVNHALHEFSFGQVDLFGTEVFGWYELPNDLDGYSDSPTAAFDLIEDCMDLAIAAEGIDPHDYAGIMMLHNDWIPMQVSLASASAYSVPVSLSFQDGSTGQWRVMRVSELSLLNRSSYTHELGHTFGFRHSGPVGGLEYGSPWDLMSSGSCSDDPACVEVHPIGYYKSEAGWIPSNREILISAPMPWTGTSQDIRLHNLAKMPSIFLADQLLARVDLGWSNLTFEARVARPDTYDGILPGSGVIVHHIKSPGTLNPQPRVYGGLDVNSAVDVEGSRFTVGEVFTEVVEAGKIAMRVLALNRDNQSEIVSFDIRLELSPHDPLGSCANQQQIDEQACEALVQLADLADSLPAGFAGSQYPCWWPGVVCQDLDGDGVEEITALRMNTEHSMGWDLTLTSAEDGLFDALPDLNQLTLRHDVDGPLPSSIAGLASLRFLHLNHSGLQGSLPEALGDLTLLEHLNVEYSTLTGPLPASIGELHELTGLYTKGSAMAGPFPDEILSITPNHVSVASGLCIPISPAFDAWIDSLLGISSDAARCGVYVDASAPSGGDGTKWHPYPTISQGVNAANPGETVSVAPGSYPEAVSLWKPVSVVGTGELEVEVPFAGSWHADSPGAEIRNIRFIGRPGSTAVRASRPHTIEGCQFEDHTIGILNSRVAGDTSIVRNRFLDNHYGVMSFDSGWSNYLHVTNNVFVQGRMATYSHDSRTRVEHNLMSGFHTGVGHVLHPDRNLPISYVRNNLIVDAVVGVMGSNLDRSELKLFSNAIEANDPTDGVPADDMFWTYDTACHAPTSNWLPFKDDFGPDADCVDQGSGANDPDGSPADIGPYGGPFGGPWWAEFPCVGPLCAP